MAEETISREKYNALRKDFLEIKNTSSEALSLIEQAKDWLIENDKKEVLKPLEAVEKAFEEIRDEASKALSLLEKLTIEEAEDRLRPGVEILREKLKNFNL